MKLTKREIILLVIVLVLGSTFLFVKYVYSPLDKDIKKLKDEYEQLVEEEAKVKLLDEKIKILKDELLEIENSSNEAYEGMLDIWDQAANLVYMEKVTKNLCDKVVINSYTPVDVGNLRSADVNLDIVTNYDNLQKILKNLEEGQHYCTIENISMDVRSRDSEDWPPLELNVNLTVRFYVKGQDTDYPDNYDFMKGKFNKKNIFQEK
ncbi:GspMb/PilO family protein [Herbinix luporum]|uniref:Uncharacterized protein n=1 Tax=Herbinix luporum TaxID=1679721 RepID=A0A0K8J6N3_9FIRM|nr:GspMb/PilO family protein [Herbinix luporum]CUH93140.1 hypothetical protein SD1D_1594 [Herbinix luporum]